MSIWTPLPVSVFIWTAWILLRQEAGSLPTLRTSLHLWATPIIVSGARALMLGWLCRLGALGVVAGFMACAAVSGRAILKWMAPCLAAPAARHPASKTENSGPGVEHRWPILVGLGVTALMTSALGVALTGLSYPAILAITVIIPTAAAIIMWPRVLPWPWRSRGRRRPVAPVEVDTFHLVIAVVLLFAGTAALAPTIETDPLAFHAVKTARILSAHRLVPRTYHVFDFYPSGWELLEAVQQGVGGAFTTGWFNVILLAGLGGLTWRLARLTLPPAWSRLAALMVITNPFLAHQAAMGKNDLLVAVFAVAAIFALAAGTRPTAGRAACAGALAGAAFATKYTGGFVLIAVGAMLLQHRRRGHRPAPWLYLLAAAAAVGGPVLAFNWLEVGNPLHPFGPAALQGPFMTPTSLARMHTVLWFLTDQHPAAVTWHLTLARAFATGDESCVYWAVLLPWLLLTRRWPRPFASVAVAGAVLLLSWMSGPGQVRYGTPLFALGAVLAMHGLASLPGRWSGRAAAGIIGLQVLHVLTAAFVALSWRAGAGLEPANAYLARVATSYQAAVLAVNARTGPRDHLVLHGEFRAAPLIARADSSLHGREAFLAYPLVHDSRSVDEIWKRVRQQGWTHMLYNRLTAFYWMALMADDPWSARELRLWAAFWRRHAELVWESPTIDIDMGYFYLFRLVPKDVVRSRAVLPGIEGWIHTIEQAPNAALTGVGAGRLDDLEAAAGDFASVDLIKAVLLRARLSPLAIHDLHVRARARGFRSPSVCDTLARDSLALGRRDEAAGLWREAAALEPRGPWAAMAIAAEGAR